jgi:prophage regulatory protein
MQRHPGKSINTGHASMRILRIPEMIAELGLSRSTIYEEVKRGRLAPPIPLSGHAVGWLESDKIAYIEARIADRDAGVRCRAPPRRPVPSNCKKQLQRRT